MGTQTKDPVYMDAERRFKELENETEKLRTESKKYFDAINGVLDHKIEFSKAVEEVYKPITGKLSDTNTVSPEGNPEGIKACEQYRDVVKELKETLKPELDLIETRVIGPAEEMLRIIKVIRKMATKRDHKQLDLDRHTNSLTKIQNKKERNANEEKKLYQAENNVEIATQEFNYYNEMLKEELPKLFELETQFIRPLFQSFYFMQLNIYYTIYSRMEEMKIPYFDLVSSIEESFHNKRGDIQQQTEAIGITCFRVGHAKSKIELTRKRLGKEQEAQNGATTSTGLPPPPYDPNTYPQQPAHAQPGYGSPAAIPTGYGAPAAVPGYSAPSVAPGYGAPAASALPGYNQPGSAVSAGPPATGDYKGAVPPPAAHATTPGVQYCTVLYDFIPQTEQDLALKAGEIIEIVERTPDANGWWVGKLNGKTGVFPGNYVQLQ